MGSSENNLPSGWAEKTKDGRIFYYKPEVCTADDWENAEHESPDAATQDRPVHEIHYFLSEKDAKDLFRQVSSREDLFSDTSLFNVLYIEMQQAHPESMMFRSLDNDTSKLYNLRFRPRPHSMSSLIHLREYYEEMTRRGWQEVCNV